MLSVGYDDNKIDNLKKEISKYLAMKDFRSTK